MRTSRATWVLIDRYDTLSNLQLSNDVIRSLGLSTNSWFPTSWWKLVVLTYYLIYNTLRIFICLATFLYDFINYVWHAIFWTKNVEFELKQSDSVVLSSHSVSFSNHVHKSSSIATKSTKKLCWSRFGTIYLARRMNFWDTKISDWLLLLFKCLKRYDASIFDGTKCPPNQYFPWRLWIFIVFMGNVDLH